MALAIDDRPSVAERAKKLRRIDTDIHNDLPSLNELRPYLAREFHPWLENGGPSFARRYYTNTGSGVMDDSIREEDGLAADDPGWTVKQLMASTRSTSVSSPGR